jgi:hypothetical protein
VQLNKRFSHGFQAGASYTWAHEIDDGQSFGESTNNLFLSNAFSFLGNGNYKLDKGSGVLDQRHRFVLNWVWSPRFTHRTDAFSRFVVNNWQLSSVTTMASGHPSGSLNVSLKDTPVTGMFSNFSLNGTGFSGRVPFLPVNSYYLPVGRAPEQGAAVRRREPLPVVPELRGIQPGQHLGGPRLYELAGVHGNQGHPDSDADEPVRSRQRRGSSGRDGSAPHAGEPAVRVLIWRDRPPAGPGGPVPAVICPNCFWAR